MIDITTIQNEVVEVDPQDIVGLAPLGAFTVDVVMRNDERLVVSGRLDEIKKELEDQGVDFPISWMK